MPKKRDYYEVLGINKDAGTDDVKKSYRQLALKFHPDRVPPEQKTEAEEKFKEISEAYAVLSDPQKRNLYDQYGHAGIDQKYAYEDLFRGADFSSIFGDSGSIFEQIFGNFGFDFFRSGRRSSRGKGRDLEITVDITLEEAATGVEKSITIPRYEVCNTCSGSGAMPGTRKVACSQCRGTGRQVISSGFFQMSQTCPKCRGQGEFIQTSCPECQGDGKIRKTHSLTVKIPAGVGTGSTVRLKGEGEAGAMMRGDLYLIIEVKPHPIFEREGNDIIAQIHISVARAILGSNVSVPTLDGKVEMKIPPGTQSGKVFRLKGKGIPDVHGRDVGDELVVVLVDIPTRITAEQRRLIEEFAKISGENLLSKESIVEKIKRTFLRE